MGVCLAPSSSDAGPEPDLNRYLPEIGYGVRGGADKGRRKSLPQLTCAAGGVGTTGVFVRNFRAGQRLGLVIDTRRRQVRTRCAS